MFFGSGKKSAVRPWRQDFRDVKLLPDLKIVRTYFIYNGAVIAFLVVFAGLFTYQEYSISVRRESLDTLRSEVRRETPADKKIVAASGAFSRELNRVSGAARFAEVPVRPEALFVALARAQVPNGRYTSIVFTSPDTASGQILIDGAMAPSAGNSAPVEIGALIARLRDLPVWNGCSRNVELVSSSPAEDLNIFSYTVRVTWKAGAGAAKK